VLRDRRPPAGVRCVETLLRQGATVEEVLRALVLEEGVRQRRFGGLDPRARDVHGRGGRVHLRVDLTAVDGGDHLSRTDAIADVHGNARERAGSFGSIRRVCGMKLPEI
jgi:hypothetical protein